MDKNSEQMPQFIENKQEQSLDDQINQDSQMQDQSKEKMVDLVIVSKDSNQNLGQGVICHSQRNHEAQ